MQFRPVPAFPRPAALLSALALAVLTAVPAFAQSGDPEPSRLPGGERYRIELSGTLWNPSLVGLISSEQFGIVGDSIDFENDLGFTQTRFKDLRLVLRPGRKTKFRVQYTPVQYTASTSLNRDIVFNGINFPVSVPLNSTFSWKVLRVGFEYDALYTDRGYVGVLIEGRYTQLDAELSSVLSDEFTRLRVPLPAIGLVGRFYPVPELAINFEVSGFQVPDIDPDYKGQYYDWDIHGTFNFTDYVGFQVGWRRMTTFLEIERDTGDLKFQGMWFGAAVRY